MTRKFDTIFNTDFIDGSWNSKKKTGSQQLPDWKYVTSGQVGG
jgi:predicted FMN-binding regulatory protein PaiB